MAKATKKKIQKFKDAQKYLQIFFETAPTEDVRKLWDVLSALRGPDDVEENNSVGDGFLDLKHSTTTVIRQAFLGKKVQEFPADFSEDSARRARIRESLDGPPDSHFLCHAREAFDALGLKWGGETDER